MNKKLIKVGIKDKTYCYSNGNLVSYILTFGEKIEKEFIVKAIKKSLNRFPQFSYTPVLKNNEVFYVKNTKEIKFVSRARLAQVYLGTDDTNGYLFVLNYTGKTLTFVSCHALGDYFAMSQFLKAFLNNLVCLCGLKAIRDNSKIDLNNKDLFYPYEQYKNEAAKKYEIRGKEDKTLLLLAKVDKKVQTSTIRISSKDYLSYMKNENASFIPLLFDVVSYGLEDKFSNDNESALGVITANLRKSFNSNCVTNFSETLAIKHCYDDRKLSVSERCAIYKNEIKNQLTQENIQGIINDKTNQVIQVENGTKSSRDMTNVPTFIISYVGKDEFTGIHDGLVKNYKIDGCLETSPCLFIACMAKEKTINLYLYTNKYIDEISSCIVDELNKRGIKSKIGKGLACIPTKLDFRKFKRI